MVDLDTPVLSLLSTHSEPELAHFPEDSQAFDDDALCESTELAPNLKAHAAELPYDTSGC